MVAQLVHCNSEEPGIKRVKSGQGFYYVSASGKKISDRKLLGRIENIVIPPNWENVWICPHPNGYIQATGIDIKGRKQYLYHNDYIEYRQEEKFRKLLQFGYHLPAIRTAIDGNLRKRSWCKEKVLALVLLVLDEYYLRIGNNVYKNANGTFGLTTLRRKHLLSEDEKLVLNYKAKSGKQRVLSIENKTIARLIQQCAELPGHELFKYFDEEGHRHTLGSAEVNTFLKELTGKKFTSKYFRTWGGSMLAIKHYPDAVRAIEEAPRKKLRTEIVRQVSAKLGNTLAVCEKYYIHPKVLNYLEARPRKLTQYRTRKSELKQYLDEEELVLMAILRS